MKTCNYPGCPFIARIQGRCGYHDPEFTGEDMKCIVPGCVNEHKAVYDVCPTHRSQELDGVLHDRFGDPVYFGKDNNPIKIKDLGDNHLNNILRLIQTSAELRCKLTGAPDWEEKAGARFKLLKAEALFRDKCACNNGVLETRTITKDGRTEVHETLCSCKIGQERATAKKILENKDKRLHLYVILSCLIAGGMGARLIEFLMYYARHS